MALLRGIQSMTDYLDKQAVREKQKRKEKFLTVLPTYLEGQLSGIKDEKSLFSTIPKLSAQMYAFGPEVGQAANQILSQLADVKYKEIAQVKQEEENKDTLDVLGESSKNIPEVAKLLDRKDISDEVKIKTLPAIIQANTISTTGMGVQKNGKYFYQEWTRKGNNPYEPGRNFEILPDKSGGYGLDDLGTIGVNDNIPLTMEAMKYMEEEASYKQRAQDTLNKSLILQAGQIDIYNKKADEKQLRDTRAEVYKEIGKEGYVYADKDPTTGRKYYYRDIQKPTLPNAPGVITYKTSREIVDPANIENIGQGFEKSDEITQTDLYGSDKALNTEKRIQGEYLVSLKISRDTLMGAPDPKTRATYYDADKVIKALRDIGEDKRADILEQIRDNTDRIRRSYSGVNTGSTSYLKNPLEE